MLATPLLDQHHRARARMIEFAGWELPVQYSGVTAEVQAVHTGCGLFDVSHLTRFELHQAGLGALLDTVVCSAWGSLNPGQAAYSLLLNESGGVVDDVMGYHLEPDHWTVISNAGTRKQVIAHLQQYLAPVDWQPMAGAIMALQGPTVVPTLGKLCTLDLGVMPFRACGLAEVAGVPGMLARGGYTGEDGFEFCCAASEAGKVWEACLEAGAVPCGLGARDVLRLEARLPLYGHELRAEWTPYESGAGFAVDDSKADFVGKAALAGKEHPPHRLYGLRMQDGAIPREGYAVHTPQGGGLVTSGTFSPTLKGGIALARLPAGLEAETAVSVVIRDAPHPAVVHHGRFVPRANQLQARGHRL